MSDLYVSGHFTEILLNKIKPILQKLITNGGEDYSINQSDLTDKEKYIYEVTQQIIQLDDIFNQLELSITFLSNFRSTDKLKIKDITRADHIKYHIENYIIRIVGTYDRSLILTNEVFRLGNIPRNCTQNIILQNTKIKDTATFTILKEIEKFVQNFREERNLIIHRGIYSTKQLRSLELLYKSPLILDKDVVPKSLPKFLADKYVKNIKENTSKFNKKLFYLFSKLYKELEIQFNKELFLLKEHK